MNIGIDITPFINQNAGIARYVSNLIHNLVELDKENNYVLYNFFGNHKARNLPKAQNLTIKPYDFPPQIAKAIFVLLKSKSTDLLTKHTDIMHSTVFTLPPAKKKPSVITIHDLAFLHYPQFYTKQNRRFYKSMTKYAIDNSNSVIAYSNSTKNDLINQLGADEAKIEVIPLGVENKFKPSTAEQIENLRIKYKLPKKYLMTLSTLQPRKNLENLLIAYKKLVNNKDCDYPLLIVGRKGWQYKNIFEKLTELKLENKVTLTGFVDDEDLPSLYSGAELFIYPSLYEGFGLPIIESMACATPVACSNTSSMPEAAGNAALMFDPTAPEDITEAMHKILSDSAITESLIKKGLVQSAKFNWTITAQKTLEVYNTIA